jgi:hypothetical protein
VLCSGDANGSIEINATGGTGSYQYSLNGGSSQPGNTFTGLAPGDYLVTVTDQNGCTGSDSTTVTEPPPLTVTASVISNVSTCGGSDGIAFAIATGGNAPLSYSWSDIFNQTDSTATNLEAGIYTVTVTDMNGCSAIDTVTITQGGPVEICGNMIDDNCNGDVDEGCSISMQIKVFIEGYYLGGFMQPVLLNQNVAGATGTETDTIHVELHSVVDPTIIVDQSPAVLSTTGIGMCSFTVANAGTQYWIAVKHRNSIQTWSGTPFVLNPGLNQYDFTDASTKAFGQNMKDVFNENIWSIFTGDLNQDEYIDIFDFPDYDIDNQNFVSFTYAASDFNGDGYVDIFDFPLFDSNNQNFIFSIHP